MEMEEVQTFKYLDFIFNRKDYEKDHIRSYKRIKKER